MTAYRGTWLITGGAGYIGAHVVHEFRREGYGVVVLDDLSTGHAERLGGSVRLVEGRCQDSALVAGLVGDFDIRGVVHLAARKHARESARSPLLYWSENVGALLGVLQGISGSGVRHMVLSSSCSVYGSAGEVTPNTPTDPVSPYGRTKLVSEMALADCAEEIGLTWVALRYFNVIGNGDFTMAHDTSTECLVPAATRLLSSGQIPHVYGLDFPTPDGSALRDYIDVRDLARAHLLAAQELERSPDSVAWRTGLDVGRGSPVSVLEVLGAVAEALGVPVVYHDGGRQPADPPAVWTSASPALRYLGWRPTHDLRSSVTAHVSSAGSSA